MPFEYFGSRFTPRRVIVAALYAISASALFTVISGHAMEWLPDYGKNIAFTRSFASFLAATWVRQSPE